MMPFRQDSGTLTGTLTDTQLITEEPKNTSPLSILAFKNYQ